MVNRFAQLSASEKRLSAIVALLLAAAVVLVVVVRCLDVLEQLDETIASQQLVLMDAAQYASLAEPVDEAYAAMAEQHSSEWTQEQIHDRLRVEIARLSLRNIPGDGTAIPAVNKPGDLLVDIRSWPVGALDDSGEGYRTYQMNFRTEPTSIQNIALFLERLQQSQQALRVDGLELIRQPLSTAVTGTFRVTRTVIGDPGSPQPAVAAAPEKAPTNLAVNGDFAQWNPEQSTAPGWSVANASLSLEKDIVEGGDSAAAIHAQQPNAELYQVQQLRAGKVYEIGFVARVSGAAQVRVVEEKSGRPLQGDALLETGPAACEYKYRFTVPGAIGAKVSLRAPSFVITENGADLVVDNVTLREAEA